MTVVDLEHPPEHHPVEREQATHSELRKPPRWRSTRPRARDLWWLSPVGSLLMVIPLSLLVAIRIPDADYRFFYKAPRVLTVSEGLLFLTATGVCAFGTMLPSLLRRRASRRTWPTLPNSQLSVLRGSENVAFWLTIAGYLLLAALGVARGATPSVLIDAVTSQDNYTGQLKKLFAPVAGITSLTQVGIAYVVVAGLLLCHGRNPRVVRRLVIVLVLGLIRSFLLTERLALLELIVPLVAIGAARLRQRARRSGWLTLAPLLALPLLLVIFGAFEYSRSWVFYRSRTTLSFPEFIVNRLAGYYATSYNNGALQLAHAHVPGRLPYDSIQVLWTAPGVAQLDLYHRLTGQYGGDLLTNVLQQNGNPEFNNPGGLAVPFVDFGHVGGFVYFLLAGLVVGFAYRSWRAGSPVGLLTYPVLFTGLLELPRYVYWTQGRVFPAMVFLLVVAWLMRRSTHERVRAGSMSDACGANHGRRSPSVADPSKARVGQ